MSCRATNWHHIAFLPVSFTKPVTWAYARLQPSSCVNLATSCNLVHVLTSYNLSFRFGTYAAPLPSSSLWTYATPLPSSPFLSFAVSQNYLNSISFHGTNRQTLLNDFVRHAQIQNIQLKLQISSPKFPLLLFTLSHTPTHKLHYRSTHLSGYSANFQCCKSCRTPCQPSGSTRCPTNMTQGSQRKPSRVNNTKSILFEKFISTKENAPPKM